MGPNGARRFFPTNPDLADILGRTDLNFENFYFLICWTPNFVSKIYAHPLPRVYAIFLFAIEYSAKAQHTTTGPRAPGVATPPVRAPVVGC